MRLDILDVISNVKDELNRMEDFLEHCETTDEELVSDIKLSIDRMSDIENRIDFALILAVYAGSINCENDYEYDCDNADWREKYLSAASQVDFEYDEEGYVDSEWAYDNANLLVKKMFD